MAVFSWQSGIDITEELKGGIPKLFQWDKRWASLSYGSSSMEISGCGPTCLSMVCCGLTGKGDWDPYSVARMAEEKGYYIPGTGTSWSLMTEGAEVLGIKGEETAFSRENILKVLKSGSPIICAVGPGDFTAEGHFIVLTGVNEEGRLIVHDPNSRENSEKTWDVDRVMGQMKNLWAFSR